MARSDEKRRTRNRIYSTLAGLLIVILGVVALSAFLHVGHARIDEKVYSSPPATLKYVIKAQDRYRLNDLDENGHNDYAPSLRALEEAGCITTHLASGDVHGYHYEVLHADEWKVGVRATPDTKGGLSYYIDETRIIRASRDGPADAQSKIFWHPEHGDMWGPDR